MPRKKIEKTDTVEPIKVSEVEKKRNALIDELRPKLLTQSQLKRGGSTIRSRFIAETGYVAIIDEINELGKELGLPPVGFSDLRKRS